jgi:hypothetical protein
MSQNYEKLKTLLKKSQFLDKDLLPQVQAAADARSPPRRRHKE